MNCAASGSLPLRFEWKKDGEEVTNSRIVIQTEEDYSSLGIKKLQFEDRGNYSCVVTNSQGTDSLAAVLDIKQPVKFVVEPADLTVREGDRVTVPCRASGSPEPRIAWSSLDLKSVNVLDDSLVFESADQSVAGRYKCEASNRIGESVSKIIGIRVTGIFGWRIDSYISFLMLLFYD